MVNVGSGEPLPSKDTVELQQEAMPQLVDVRLWPGEVTAEDLSAGKEPLPLDFVIKVLPGPLPITFTIATLWDNAAGKWNSEIVLNGSATDNSWESDLPGHGC